MGLSVGLPYLCPLLIPHICYNHREQRFGYDCYSVTHH